MLNASILICRPDPRLDAEGTLRKARKTNAVMINIESISSGPREIGKVAMFLQTTIIHSSNAAWLTGLYFGVREALGSTNDSIMADEIEFVSDEDVPKMEKVKRKTVSTSKFRFSLQLIL